jgi:hypothetical protein
MQLAHHHELLGKHHDLHQTDRLQFDSRTQQLGYFPGSETIVSFFTLK